MKTGGSALVPDFIITLTVRTRGGHDGPRGTEEIRTATKFPAVDRLAQELAAAPGEPSRAQLCKQIEEAIAADLVPAAMHLFHQHQKS